MVNIFAGKKSFAQIVAPLTSVSDELANYASEKNQEIDKNTDLIATLQLENEAGKTEVARAQSVLTKINDLLN